MMNNTFQIREGPLLEKYWAKEKTLLIVMALPICIIPGFNIFALMMFRKLQRRYREIVTLRDKQNIKELLAIINDTKIKIAEIKTKARLKLRTLNIVFESQASLYALVDLRRIEAKKIIERELGKMTFFSDLHFISQNKQHYETILERIEFNNDSNEQEIGVEDEKEKLLEGYWDTNRLLHRTNVQFFVVLALVTVLISLFGLIPECYVYNKSKVNYQKWITLKKDATTEEILENIAKENAKTKVGKISTMMGIYILVERGEPEAIDEVERLLPRCVNNSPFLLGADLADRCKQLINYLRSQQIEEITIKEGLSKKVTKVQFVSEEMLEKEKCMITGLPVNLKEEEFILCPYCGRYAKRELMENWLEEKNHCPVCREKLTIEECPKALIRKT